MSEAKAYRRFREGVALWRDRIDRIENIMVDGMPDVNYCVDKYECWIEIKTPTEPKKLYTPLFGSNHKLSQSQKNWFLRQKNAGGNGFILIETNMTLFLINCSDIGVVDKLNELPIGDIFFKSEFTADLPLSKSDWAELRATIIKICKANHEQI